MFEANDLGTLSVFDITEAKSGIWPDKLTQAELVCRQVNLETAEEMQATMERTGLYLPRETTRRLERGCQGYAGFVGTSLATYGWVSFGLEAMGNTGFGFQTPPDDAYLFDFATRLDYRGQGLYPTLLRLILTELARQNFKRAWIGTAPGNLTSARSIARAGFRKIADTQITLRTIDKPAQIKFVATQESNPALLEIAKRAHVAY